MDDAQAAKLRALAEKTDRDAYARGQHLGVLIAPDELLALLDERDAMRRELDEQKRVIDDAYAALGGDAWWMDPPDGGSPTLAEMVAKANEDGRALYDVKRARDAAMALLAKADRLFDEASDVRQTFPMVSIAHWMDEYRALLGDGGEAK